MDCALHNRSFRACVPPPPVVAQPKQERQKLVETRRNSKQRTQLSSRWGHAHHAKKNNNARDKSTTMHRNIPTGVDKRVCVPRIPLHANKQTLGIHSTRPPVRVAPGTHRVTAALAPPMEVHALQVGRRVNTTVKWGACAETRPFCTAAIHLGISLQKTVVRGGPPCSRKGWGGRGEER